MFVDDQLPPRTFGTHVKYLLPTDELDEEAEEDRELPQGRPSNREARIKAKDTESRCCESQFSPAGRRYVCVGYSATSFLNASR